MLSGTFCYVAFTAQSCKLLQLRVLCNEAQVVAVQVFMGIGCGGMMSMLLNIVAISAPAEHFSATAGNTLCVIS